MTLATVIAVGFVVLVLVGVVTWEPAAFWRWLMFRAPAWVDRLLFRVICTAMLLAISLIGITAWSVLR